MKARIIDMFARNGFFVGMTLAMSAIFHGTGTFSQAMGGYLLGAVIVTILTKGMQHK